METTATGSGGFPLSVSVSFSCAGLLTLAANQSAFSYDESQQIPCVESAKKTPVQTLLLTPHRLDCYVMLQGNFPF